MKAMKVNEVQTPKLQSIIDEVGFKIQQIYDFDFEEDRLKRLLKKYKDLIEIYSDNGYSTFEIAEEVLSAQNPRWRKQVYGSDDTDE